jgi:hypothetical protein
MLRVLVAAATFVFLREGSISAGLTDKKSKIFFTFYNGFLVGQLAPEYPDNTTEGLDTELPGVAAYTKEPFMQQNKLLKTNCMNALSYKKNNRKRLDKMRKIKRALKNREDYDQNAYYIFLIKKSEKGQKNGIMFVKTYVLHSEASETLVEQSRLQSLSGPFNRHFGFMFMENSGQLKANSQKLYHTVAHGLAHGAFGLEHPWQSKGTTQGSTHNLMDYTTKTPNNLLRKYQWYVIHNPRLSLFGGAEEDVSEDAINEITEYLENLDREVALAINNAFPQPESGTGENINDNSGNFYGFITYVVNWIEGKVKPDININLFNHQDPREFGNGFEGVSYVINYWKENGNFIKNHKLYQKRGHIAEYGLYYGATGLFTINRQGQFTDEYDYLPTAIDAVDQGAKMHDIGYDKVYAVGLEGLLNSWATTPADIKAVEAWDIVKDIGVGGVDPFNQTNITQDEIEAAKSGVWGFKKTAGNKILHIAHWMQINYPDVAQPIGMEDVKGEPNSVTFNYAVTYNYQKFLEYYMYEEYDEKYEYRFFRIREEKWEKNNDDNYIPIPPKK